MIRVVTVDGEYTFGKESSVGFVGRFVIVTEGLHKETSFPVHRVIRVEVNE